VIEAAIANAAVSAINLAGFIIKSSLAWTCSETFFFGRFQAIGAPILPRPKKKFTNQKGKKPARYNYRAGHEFALRRYLE